MSQHPERLPGLSKQPPPGPRASLLREDNRDILPHSAPARDLTPPVEEKISFSQQGTLFISRRK